MSCRFEPASADRSFDERTDKEPTCFPKAAFRFVKDLNVAKELVIPEPIFLAGVQPHPDIDEAEVVAEAAIQWNDSFPERHLLLYEQHSEPRRWISPTQPAFGRR